jgi:hypothetical protein
MRLLGEVTANDDGENSKTIQANIFGYTDDVKPDNLAWAFPLEEDCIVPEIGDKVWINVEKHNESEGYDFNNQYYARATEITYKEAYKLTDSDSHKARDDGKVTAPTATISEPDLITSTTYPDNKVEKIGGITYEHDIVEKRFTLTDSLGSYFQFADGKNVIKTTSDRFDVTDGDWSTHATGIFAHEDGAGNLIQTSSSTIEMIGKGTNTLMLKNDTSGLQEQLEELWSAIDGLATELSNLTTTGSPVAQATSPASAASIATFKATTVAVKKALVQLTFKD